MTLDDFRNYINETRWADLDLALCIKVNGHIFPITGVGERDGGYLAVNVDGLSASWCSVRDPEHILTTSPDEEAHSHASYLAHCNGLDRPDQTS